MENIKRISGGEESLVISCVAIEKDGKVLCVLIWL